GWRLFTLAATAADQQLLALTPHVLRGLVARVQECAHLSVLDGCGLLTLLSESPPWAIQAVPWVGRIAPLHCTSAGGALLFDHTDGEVRALLGGADLAGGGPNAPHAVEEVLARLHAARRRGFAVVSEEFETGHVAAAAPVRDFRGRVVAAGNGSAPKFRLGRSLAAAGGEGEGAGGRVAAAVGPAGPPGRGGRGARGGGARWPGAGVITRAVPFFSAGLRLDADLHLPGDGGAGQVQYPVVIACSGYQGQKVIHPARFARALTPRGYAVLAFDYRGFGSSEGPRGRVVPQEQAEDVRAAV